MFCECCGGWAARRVARPRLRSSMSSCKPCSSLVAARPVPVAHKWLTVCFFSTVCCKFAGPSSHGAAAAAPWAPRNGGGSNSGTTAMQPCFSSAAAAWSRQQLARALPPAAAAGGGSCCQQQPRAKRMSKLWLVHVQTHVGLLCGWLCGNTRVCLLPCRSPCGWLGARPQAGTAACGVNLEKEVYRQQAGLAEARSLVVPPLPWDPVLGFCPRQHDASLVMLATIRF